ncbi:Rfa2p [Ascoidea rubescens DSM 1968]|uniref:Replication protein A, subunit RPA32 n=1 Tax=Ascoidea rubescens DSM 1968 TaxID=1344418 RepID=A0A1D2VEK0_9ASCO|nr:replication protein A, subunit RPA32 [Ascoidea rubescens DSM 1968]ODV60039.1 replication protein A, subunit RPA32 [Ascoidea rubescens DSM 1968]
MASYTSYQTNFSNNKNDYSNHDGGSGGFNASQSAHSNSQSKSYGKLTITPITLKQLNESEQKVPDGEYLINNIELSVISIIGIIRNITDNTSNLIIKIEDGTGSFEFKKWQNDNSDSNPNSDLNKPDDFQVGEYIHINGTLRDFNSKKTLQHPIIKKIDDYNQVLYHYLECCKVHLSAQNNVHNENDYNHNKNLNNDNLFISDSQNINDNSLSLDDRVYNIVLQNVSRMQEGVPVQYISQQLGEPFEKISMICSKLSDEGRIFNADDDSYLAA